jgi:pyruvate,water dikinase
VAGLTRFIKNIFNRSGGGEPVETPDALRSMFKTRYWSFRDLINANNNALQIMASMEHAIRESQSFGMAFIRGNCTALSVNVYKIIECLNEIAPDRYRELYNVFAEIRSRLNQSLEMPSEFAGGELVVPLEAINKDMADLVGSKMANLGEIVNRVGLPVPEGFVISAPAYHLFMQHEGIQEEINRLIQPLDLEDMEMLHRASAEIQQLIIQSPLPDEMEEAILTAYRSLEEKAGKGTHVSMRSSALGEDMESASFAGQFASRLNVNNVLLPNTYKEILASKYSPQAITYRLNMGFRDEDIAMCVGCMAMVEAISSGVMYSRDPGNIRNNVVLINAVWGLGKSVVDGTVSPDLFVVSNESPKRILKREIRRKDQKFVCFPEEGVCRMAVVGDEKEEPAIADELAVSLAGLASQLEDHFGAPQDIEWSLATDGSVRILQSRPLRQLDSRPEGLRKVPDLELAQPVILDGGVTVSPGVASGPAFLVDSTVDILRFPPGAVLIAEHALPRWATLLGRASAVITEHGGIAGHLATVSREFNVPALFDLREATTKIKNGDIITVDADGRKVYSGKVEPLLKDSSVKKSSIMKGRPVYNTLEEVLAIVTPLNLTNLDANNFRAEGCRTYHDITRYCHENAVKEMFRFGKDHHFSERSSKQLVCDVPMRWWVLDLQDGLKQPVEGDKVGLEDIASLPMLALWEGISAVPWKGPPPVDTKGLASIMLRSTMDPSLVLTRRSRYGERNYFMISKQFCNLTSHFGYHFSTVEAFLGDRSKANYVSFNFKGGGADYSRRVGRVRFIEQILKKFDFRVEINEDHIMARLEGHARDFSSGRLKVLGYLTVHTRQLDMIMANNKTVSYYTDQMLKDLQFLVSD